MKLISMAAFFAAIFLSNAAWAESAGILVPSGVPGAPVQVEFRFNPFCGPSHEALHDVIGPLREQLAESRNVDFHVIPLQLGSEPYEKKSLAVLKCRMDTAGLFAGLASVSAEAEDSMTRGDSETHTFSWDKLRPDDSCFNLQPYEQKIDADRALVYSKGDAYTPSLFIAGKEVSAFDLNEVRAALNEAIKLHSR